jgi:hypothetical protein
MCTCMPSVTLVVSTEYGPMVSPLPYWQWVPITAVSWIRFAARSILCIFDSTFFLILEELIAIVYFKLGYFSNKELTIDILPIILLSFKDRLSSKYPMIFQSLYLSEDDRYSKSLECPPAPNNN